MANILISNNNTDEEKATNTLQEAKNARADIMSQNSILNKKINSITNNQDYYGIAESLPKQLQRLSEAIEANLKSTDEQTRLSAQNAKALLAEINAKKEAKKLEDEYRKGLAALNKVNAEGASSAEKLFEIIDNFDTVSDNAPALAETLNQIESSLKKFDDKIKDTTKAVYQNRKALSDEEKQVRKEGAAKYKEKAKLAGEIDKETAKTWKEVGSTLRDIFKTLDINQLAQTFAPSSRQQLQQDIQTNYGIGGKEFQKFKKDLFNSVNKEIYSSEDIVQAMGTLSSVSIDNTETATKYFEDLVRGQKILGLSAQTQETLLRLNNVTGRNELKFYTNQVAKFQQSSLGLNKKQLDELVSLNANLMTKAADIGIDTEAFQQMSVNEQAAFEATRAGYGAKYTQAMGSLLANTDTTAALLGMDSGELSQRLARGESLTDLLRNGAGSRAALNVLKSGDEAAITRYYEHAKAAWGIDENTWSILRMIAQQENDLNKNLQTATKASQKNTDAIKAQEDAYGESLTGIQKFINRVSNWWNGNMNWTELEYLASIEKTVRIIAVLLGAKDVFSGISSIFGNGSGVSGLLSKLGIGAGGAGAAGTAGASGAGGAGAGAGGFAAGGLFATLLGVGGTILALSDATTNLLDKSVKVNPTGNKFIDTALSSYLSWERGMLMGNGYKGNTTEGNIKAVLGNTGKGALIGSFAGPAGAGIGAALGLVLGIVGTQLEKNTETAAEQNDKLDEIEKNTAVTADNTSYQGIGMVYRYRGKSNYSSGGGPVGMGDVSYPVSSRYGPREPIRTTNGHITSSFHSGTDYAAPSGTPLYSNVTGTVAGVGKDAAGANYVGVTDSKGYTHWYWHLQKPANVVKGQQVHAGELVGFVGATGNATGPHLHYTVTKPDHLDWWNAESTVDSLPFATSNIFNEGGASTASNNEGLDLSNIYRTKKTSIALNRLGDSTPVVNSIKDLKQTIISLSEQTSRNQKIMDALVNRTMQSPTV